MLQAHATQSVTPSQKESLPRLGRLCKGWLGLPPLQPCDPKTAEFAPAAQGSDVIVQHIMLAKMQ